MSDIYTHSEISDTGSDKFKKIIKMYDNNTSSTNVSELNDNENKVIDVIDSDIVKNKQQHNKNIRCFICQTTKNDSYIILNCNDVFHITCLVESQSDQLYNYKVINEEFLKTLKCPTCNTVIQNEELMFLHNKYLGFVNNKLINHGDSIKLLELQLRDLQKEISNCYNYKHKLECDKDKSKILVKTLVTMIP